LGEPAFSGIEQGKRAPRAADVHKKKTSPGGEGNMRKAERGHRGNARVVESAILIVMPIVFHYAVPLKILIPQPYSYLGSIPMLLGLALSTWGARLFRQVGAGLQWQDGGSVLVMSGPYRFSRNPMYLGMLIWLIGLAVLLGSVITFLFPILFFLLSNFLVIPLEERSMERGWGERYLGYKRTVRRWF
jgi:protein-S-isoprenylcysteine O-methyltransferase Ste14